VQAAARDAWSGKVWQDDAVVKIATRMHALRSCTPLGVARCFGMVVAVRPRTATGFIGWLSGALALWRSRPDARLAIPGEDRLAASQAIGRGRGCHEVMQALGPDRRAAFPPLRRLPAALP